MNACKSLKKNVIFREETGVKKTKHLITPLIIAIAISLFPALTTGMAVADTVGGNEPLDGNSILLRNQDLMTVTMPPTGGGDISLSYLSPEVPKIFDDHDGGNPNVIWGGLETEPPLLPKGDEYLTVEAVYGRGPAGNGPHRLAVAGVNRTEGKFTLRLFDADINSPSNPLAELFSQTAGVSSPSTGFDHSYNPAVDILANDFNNDNITDYVYVFPTVEGNRYEYHLGVTDGKDPSDQISSIAIAEAPHGELEDPPFAITRCADLALADIDGDGQKEVVAITKEKDGAMRLHAYSVDSELNITEYDSTYKVADWSYHGTVCAVETGNSSPGGSDELYVVRYHVVQYFTKSDSLTNLSLIRATAWDDGRIEWEEKASHEIFNSQPSPEGWVNNPILGQLAVGDINGDGQDECCVFNLIKEHGSTEYDGHYYIEGLWIMIFNVENNSFVLKTNPAIDTMPDISYFAVDRFNYASLSLGAFGGELIPEKNNQGELQFLIHYNYGVEYPDDPEIDDNWESEILIIEVEVNDQGEFGKYNSHALQGIKFGDTRDYSCLVPGDFAGKSLRLGTPEKITLENNISPQVIVQEPPKHIDFIQDPETDEEEMENISRLASFKTVFQERDTSSSMVSSAQKTDFSFGTSVSLSGNPGIEMEVFHASESLEAAFSEQVKKTEEINSDDYKSMTTSISVSTTNGDEVLYRRSRKVLWRYPILNRRDDKGQPLYIQVVVPEPVQGMQKIGRDTSWYQPPHISGNLLTYPWKKEQLQYGYFDLSSSKQIASGNTMGLDNATTWDVNWDQEIRKGSSVSTTVENKRSASMSASIGGVYEGFLGGIKAGVNYFSDQAFEKSSSNKNTISSEEGFTVTTPQSGFDDSSTWGYQIEPCVYSTDIGALATTFIASPGETINQKSWWNERYGKFPNPALGLPHLWRKKSSSGSSTEWEWNTQTGSRGLRGMFFYSKDKKIGPSLEKDIFGEVNIKCRIYNLAIGQKNSLDGVEVKFYYKASDNSYSPYQGEKHLIGSRRVNVGTWGEGDLPNWTLADINWNIEDLEPGYYFVHVEVDPEDEVKEMLLHDNGDRYSDNEGYFCTYVYSTTPEEGLYGIESPLAEEEDLQIENGELVITPEYPVPGDAVTVEANIRNTSETGHAVDVYATIYDERPDGTRTLVADTYIPGIMPGTSYPLSARYFPEQEGPHRLVIDINSLNGQEEVEALKRFYLGGNNAGGCMTGLMPSSFLLLFIPLYFFNKKK